MDTVDPYRFMFAFLFVIGLIGLMAVALKYYTKAKKFPGRTLFGAKDEGGRLQVVEVRYLDPRRRLMLIRRDDMEHLLLLADGRELVIESNIANGMIEPYNADEPYA